MMRTTDQRILKSGLGWLVLVISLSMLTPWAIGHLHSIQPRLALIAIVLCTLSGTGYLVSAMLTAFARTANLRDAASPLAWAIGLLLVAVSFLPRAGASQTVLMLGGAFFAVVATTLQYRGGDGSER